MCPALYPKQVITRRSPNQWPGLPRMKPDPQLRPRPIDNIVDDPVFLRLSRGHDEVPLHVTFDPLQRLACARAHQLVRNLANAQNLTRMNVDVGCLSAQSAHRRLMDQDARVRQGKTLALLARDRKS